jgi:hypothetical protein
MTATGPPKPLRLYVLSHPRTVSNLFCKLFSEHPSLKEQSRGFLFAHHFGPESQTLMKNEEMEKLNRIHRPMFAQHKYQTQLDSIEKSIAEAEATVGHYLNADPHLNDPLSRGKYRSLKTTVALSLRDHNFKSYSLGRERSHLNHRWRIRCLIFRKESAKGE